MLCGEDATDRDRRITIQTSIVMLIKQMADMSADLFTQLPTALQVREEDRERIENAFNPNPFSVVIV